MALVKRLDLLVLLIALPVFLATGLPMAGFLTGAVAWLVQTVVKEVAERRALAIAKRSVDEPHRDTSARIADMRAVAGLTAGSMIGRGWLCAIAIFAGWFIAGQDDDAGLAAAVLVIVCFTAYFVTNLVLRPFNAAPKTSELPS